jgi:16S rRNA (cytidine1402-2'-O)-methyltransferase
MSARANSPPTGAGTLYVVATPIGNRGDLSPRAKEILSSVALIAAEDTRHTGQLLHGFGIETPMRALHEHNEVDQIEGLLAQLLRGDSIAIVSDAGTPLISDPGFNLVRAASERHITISPVPGACAAIAALSAAGLPSDRFVFEGFLPSKSEARKARLHLLASDSRTLVCYEAPHRIASMLEDAANILGRDRRASIARELTKLHETLYHGALAELAERATQDITLARGELVVIISGAAEIAAVSDVEALRVMNILADELSIAQAAKLAARLTGASRRDLYDMALRQRGDVDKS